MSARAISCSYRWQSICRPGMYVASLSAALDCNWANCAHVHADCVVDDFGTLQPVSFNTMTVTEEVLNSPRSQA